MFCISVSIYYHDVSAAEAACNSLNGIVVDNHSEDYEVPLIVTLISSKSRKSVLDSALKIMWFKPSVAAHVILDASEYDASDIVRIIRGCFFGGVDISSVRIRLQTPFHPYSSKICIQIQQLEP